MTTTQSYSQVSHHSSQEHSAHNQAPYMCCKSGYDAGSSTFLPTIGAAQSHYRSDVGYETYPAPAPIRRNMNTLPWRASTYYGAGRNDKTVSNYASMPDPKAFYNKLGELDSIKVPPVFAAARNALFTRYTPNDWFVASQGNFLNASRVRGSAERMRLDTGRLVREADDKTERGQNDSGKLLSDRICDIDYWKGEVTQETDNMVAEAEALERCRQILERSLIETEDPLKIAQECLYQREKRQAIDLVHDGVEQELTREVDNIKRIQEDMRRALADSSNQGALNRAAQHELEMDGMDKFTALHLDNTSKQMRNTSRGINYYDGIERVDNTNSVPETWAKFSNDNIQRSQSERAASHAMRTAIEQLLNNSAASMVQQWNKVNLALSDRWREYVDARNKLQEHLSQTLQEIHDVEKNIELLKKCMKDKEAPMQVAQTRLVTRTRRPKVENCRDAPQHHLVSEVYQITETMGELRAQLRESENALQHLLRTKLALEHDLAVKNNSIFVDREKCMGLRKTFPMTPRVPCY